MTNFIPSHEVRRRFFFVRVLEFRCRRVIPLANHKLTSEERISCITRHDDLSPRNYWAVSLQVALFLRLEIIKTEAIVVEPVKRKTSEFIVI